MAKRKDTIESQTADAILQRVKAITIGGVEYIIAPPTLATLILVSEEVSYLPEVKLNPATPVEDALREARNFRSLADILAILILGAKRLTIEEEYTERVWGIFRRKRKRGVDMMHAELSERLVAVTTLLKMMQTEHCFAVATFLTSINLTKATKVAKTTASGR